MRLAVIGTFYKRHENTLPLIHRLFVDGTRKPDEAWLMCENQDDVDAINEAFQFLRDNDLIEDRIPDGVHVCLCPTPRFQNGSYAVLPYAYKINQALSETECDVIVYLDNGSMPQPDKYKVMAEALETNPEWGAVYCTQSRTGFNTETSFAELPVKDAFCVLNYTQVMHRHTNDLWPTSMSLANPDVADGTYWRTLHDSIGVFHPSGGREVLDTHHIPHPMAVGLDD